MTDEMNYKFGSRQGKGAFITESRSIIISLGMYKRKKKRAGRFSINRTVEKLISC